MKKRVLIVGGVAGGAQLLQDLEEIAKNMKL